TFTGVAFNNRGPANLQAGTLELLGGGTHTAAGDINVTDGTTLALGGNHTFPAGSEIPGSGPFNSTLRIPPGTSTYATDYFTEGTANFQGGQLTFSGFATFNNALNISGGTAVFNGAITEVRNLTLSSGTLQGSGLVIVSNTLNWTGGTMTGAGQTLVNSGATATLSGTGDKLLGRTYANDGTTNYTGSNLMFGPAAGTVGRINNSNLFVANGDGDFTVSNAGAHVVTNTGSGIFRRLGTGTTTFTGVAFNNEATVQLQAGTLELHG